MDTHHAPFEVCPYTKFEVSSFTRYKFMDFVI